LGTGEGGKRKITHGSLMNTSKDVVTSLRSLKTGVLAQFFSYTRRIENTPSVSVACYCLCGGFAGLKSDNTSFFSLDFD